MTEGVRIGEFRAEPVGGPRERCAICGGPVENLGRNWISGLEAANRFWLCDFHHEPFRTGAAWLETIDGKRFLFFKEPIVVSRFPV